MPPRTAQVREIPAVAEALATKDPVACAARIAEVLAGGVDRGEVVRTAALATARRFVPGMPHPHAVIALGAALDLARWSEPPELPVVQACALAASEWRDEPPAVAKHAVAGDELHLARSFLAAVRERDATEADAIFTGLLREGEERRLAGDALFEASAQDMAREGHKLPFSVGSWRLARAFGWVEGAALMRPAVHLVASAPQDVSGFGAMLREVGRSRLDLELAARNVAELDAVARSGYATALAAGPDRVASELINGLKRGRRATAYGDLVAATAAEQLVASPAALEPTLFALATRFVLAFSRTPSHTLAMLQAARAVAAQRSGDLPIPARIADPQAALTELELAIEGDDPGDAASLAMGLAELGEGDRIARALVRQAVLEDAHADAGHRLVYASWALEFAGVASSPAYASLAAVLARTPKSRSVAGV